MDNLLLYTLSLAAGFAGLIWSAGRFVQGASTTARHLGVAPLVIGLTIVALGTSAPETFTSAVAAVAGSPGIAIGNVVGSNIANICIVLGITILIRPVLIPVSMLKEEIPWLLLVSFSLVLLFYDGDLDRTDGSLLLLMMILFFWRMFRSKTIDKEPDLFAEEELSVYLADMTLGKALLLMLFALVIMVLSSTVLVWGARNIALTLGVSELMVGLTIIAVGTSLPELATSIAGAMKGHHEIAIGNIVGSNILNILLVLLFPAFLSRVQIDPLIINRDVPLMLAITVLLCALLLLLSPKQRPLGRKSGTVLIAFYFAYTAVLFTSQ